ncbi:MAG TPA: SAM-dependent methyltransferase, partial [Actinoplanes sp.]|nr:SAM-dependent methyltransferase [Actinoplanes sp.]
AHARALLDDGPDGRTACLEADLRDPKRILTHPMIDPDRPVGLLLVAVLHYVHDDGEARRSVRGMLELLPRGSFLVLSHVTLDFTGPVTTAGLLRVVAGQMRPRPRPRIAEYLDGLEPIEPGLVPVCDWRPGPDRATAAEVVNYGAVARLP